MKKKRLTFSFFILFIGTGVSVYAQVIRSTVIEKPTGEPIIWCSSFIIDPVDSIVVGHAISDLLGESTYHLIRPLKSEQFLLKFCDGYQEDTMFMFAYETNKNYQIELTPIKNLLWLTAYYNEKGIVDWDDGESLFGCSYDYVKQYEDSSKYYHQLELKKLKDEYDKEYAEYLKQVAVADSTNKKRKDEDPIMPYPYEPLLPEIVYEVYTFVSQREAYPGGTYLFLDQIYDLIVLKSEWRKKKNLTLEFKFSGYFFQADSVIVFDHKDRVSNRSGKIWKALKAKSEITDVQWIPMKLNGKNIKLRSDVGYRLEFIYRKE